MTGPAIQSDQRGLLIHHRVIHHRLIVTGTGAAGFHRKVSAIYNIQSIA
jgi:hypothetical protein